MSNRNKNRRKSVAPGFVYVVAMEGEWGTYKVGRAKDVEARLAELQTSSPKTLVALRKFWAPDAQQAEKAMHKALVDFRVRGEWFKCKVAVIDTAWAAYRGAGYRLPGIEALRSDLANGVTISWRPTTYGDARPKPRKRKRKFGGRKPVKGRGPLLPGVGVVRSASAPDRR